MKTSSDLTAREKLGRELRGILLRRHLPTLAVCLGFGAVGWWLFHRPFGFLLALFALVPLIVHAVAMRPCFFPKRGRREAALRQFIHWHGLEGDGFHLVWADGDVWFVGESVRLTEENMSALLRRAGLEGFSVEKKSSFYRGGWERERREGRAALPAAK